jgi:nucleoside permease NupC
MKTGAVGFTAFMALIVGAIARAIWLARTLRDRDLRTFALVGLAAVVMAVVFCYVDLGLTNNRITMLLGALLGVLSVLDRVRD